MTEGSGEQASSGVQVILEDCPEQVLHWLAGPEAPHARELIGVLVGALQPQAVEPRP